MANLYKLLGITFLIGKIKSKFIFHGPLEQGYFSVGYAAMKYAICIHISGLCWVISKWTSDDHFPTKWRANKQQGGGWAPTRYKYPHVLEVKPVTWPWDLLLNIRPNKELANGRLAMMAIIGMCGSLGSRVWNTTYFWLFLPNDHHHGESWCGVLRICRGWSKGESALGKQLFNFWDQSSTLSLRRTSAQKTKSRGGWLTTWGTFFFQGLTTLVIGECLTNHAEEQAESSLVTYSRKDRTCFIS